GDRVAFLDFGMFGRLGRHERRRMAFVFWALVDGDYDAVADRLLRLSTLRPGADAAGFRTAVGEAVEVWAAGDVRSYSIARLLLRQLGLGAHHGIVFPRELMLLARSLVNLESTASVIDPELSLAELTRPLLPELRRSLLLSREAVEEAWRENRFDYLDLALEVPDLLPELVARLRSDGQAPAPPPPSRRGARSAAGPLVAAACFAAGALVARSAANGARRRGAGR
ncbi:MAG: hypothetical protein ACYC1P_15535, partial [Gaiellaceae bacterium]